jgi:hypothetical protein
MSTQGVLGLQGEVSMGAEAWHTAMSTTGEIELLKKPRLRNYDKMPVWTDGWQ